MRPRRYVTLVGLSLIAGCSGNPTADPAGSPEARQTATPTLTATTTRTPDPTPTGTPTPNAKFARELLADVVAELNIAITELRFTTRNINHIDQVTGIETREPAISSEIARNLLEEVESEATSDQRERVVALRSFTNHLDAALGVVETMFEVHDGWVLGLSFYRSNRYETAAEEFDRQLAPITDGLGRISDIQEGLTDLEPTLGDDDRVKMDDFRQVLDSLSATLNGFSVLMTGAIPQVRG